MSLLFPLYALAALGILAPVLFHLFQRKPQGRREFSSLLFLQATPPTVTSRSRLSDLLLLLCRALILLLLAIAFARPFVRSAALLDVEAPSRRVVLLVDTSASMRRDGVWQDVQSQLKSTIRTFGPGDEVALVRFDRQPKVELGFDAWQQLAEKERPKQLQMQAQELQPTWRKTDLASGLTFASDLLLQRSDGTEPGTEPARRVILFTDLQEGSDLSSLQAYRWPDEINVELKVASPRQRANASLQWLPAAEEEQDSERVRVLVRNESESQSADLTLSWPESPQPPRDTIVAPGQTRVVNLTQPSGATKLVLGGDDQGFDNAVFLPITKPKEQEVWFLGKDQADTERRNSLVYYLQLSPLNTRWRNITVRAQTESQAKSEEVASAKSDVVPLVVMQDPETVLAEDVRRYVSGGGRLLVVLTSQLEDTGPMEALIGNLFGAQNVRIQQGDEDASGEYAMLSKLDFSHRLLVPFADARFSDFSKIRFWSHSTLTTDTDDAWTVIAGFDDGAPALVEKKVGQGTVWVLTSGWQPAESQLALSTKFVPMLHGFLEDTRRLNAEETQYQVGDVIPLRPSSDVQVIGPDGELHLLDPQESSFAKTEQPGVYEIRSDGRTDKIAVNLSKEESRTDRLLPGRLEQLGVVFDKTDLASVTPMQQRQMRNKELEGRQKFWRWGVLGALGLIAGETWLSRRRTEKTETQL